jgi:hypothetical protein
VAVSGSDSSDYRDQQPHCGLHGNHSQQFLARRKQVHQGEGGYFRRNHWVPIPVARDLAELNAKLLADCHHDEIRIIAGRTESVGALLLTEKQHLRPLPAENFELAEVSFPKVDQAGCAKVLTNFYSVPLKAGTVVEARAYSSMVEIRHNGVAVAQHERSYQRSQQILDLEHYLEVLERKPGALRGSKPLAQWRAQGRWPDSYDQLWELMNEKHGRPSGTRSMVAVIRMGREFGYAKLESSIARKRCCWAARMRLQSAISSC